MKNQKILITICALVILAGAYFIYQNKHEQKDVTTSPEVIGNNSENTSETSLANPASPQMIPSPWDVFQQYLGYLKNHDTAKIKTVVSDNILEFNPTCPMRRPTGVELDCNGLMDALYQSGINWKKADFVNDWEDSKQIVLSTNPAQQKSTMANAEDYAKLYIFFTKDKNGSPKFLATYSIVTTFIYKDLAKATPEQKNQRVAAGFTDSDKDGLLDKYENCKDKGADTYNNKCSTADKSKRDSLGDGWWDGVRVFFGHK